MPARNAIGHAAGPEFAERGAARDPARAIMRRMSVDQGGALRGEAEILRRTSRSFALSIQVLPRAMREPVQVAYLIARAADTIADTEARPRAMRSALLGELCDALRPGAASPRSGIA